LSFHQPPVMVKNATLDRLHQEVSPSVLSFKIRLTHLTKSLCITGLDAKQVRRLVAAITTLTDCRMKMNMN